MLADAFIPAVEKVKCCGFLLLFTAGSVQAVTDGAERESRLEGEAVYVFRYPSDRQHRLAYGVLRRKKVELSPHAESVKLTLLGFRGVGPHGLNREPPHPEAGGDELIALAC